MKKQPDSGLDAVHTRLATAVAESHIEEWGPWQWERTIDPILAECPDAECPECSRIMCPHGDTMHFHHAGCTSCAQNDGSLFDE